MNKKILRIASVSLFILLANNTVNAQIYKAFDQALSSQQITIYHENADFFRNIISEEYGTKN